MNFTQLHKILVENPEANIHIMLPSGEFIPENFHLTEVGRVHKEFIDCGGASHPGKATCVLQIWVAHDKDHRLKAAKLANILSMADRKLAVRLPVEIEYGKEFVSQYPLGDVEVTPNGLLFVLGGKYTECLAPDKCGISCCEGKC